MRVSIFNVANIEFLVLHLCSLHIPADCNTLGCNHVSDVFHQGNLLEYINTLVHSDCLVCLKTAMQLEKDGVFCSTYSCSSTWQSLSAR